MKITIVSGRAGSGKTVILNVLEDLGYYCIDNLPIGLLPELSKKIDTHHTNVAVSIDVRNFPREFKNFEEIMETLKKSYDHTEIIFIDANNKTLISRFNETRRRHPLSTKTIGLREALRTETEILRPIIDIADLRIDTSYLNAHDLKDLIHKRLNQMDNTLSLCLQSFGYKHGVPSDTDYIFDVRCLPNPYWEKTLRLKRGTDPEVIEYLESQPEVQDMYAMIQSFIERWLPIFEKENRKYLTVSIGCTGGQHRSVYLAEKIGTHFANEYSNVSIRHRDT